ncbi:ribosomal protein S18-alanine N-acetyltransferase [Noviherbaspirillum sp. UKPF54]|uniref:ribosomal protein S18-alanine N-acetyltransferase n=1 Tax=Noviherbaspirillum sp. UKPF54 TaxID=2601898 RepID=UPI001FF021D3|nr:ribosomal protein S18-alanine N-acetyltransferase [Noviherbaspirillum sp. UKPF54]
MSAVYVASGETPDPATMRFEPMKVDDLPEVLVIENDVYPHPWTRGNFLDSMYSGYQTWTLREASGALAGYFLLMLAVDEAHLLNISVRRDLHGHGVGRLQLDKVMALSKENGMQSVLLEVRPSNRRALAVYQHYGFVQIGQRRGYYPAAGGAREDAIVMRFHL